jgi:hypothetical protein
MARLLASEPCRQQGQAALKLLDRPLRGQGVTGGETGRRAGPFEVRGGPADRSHTLATKFDSSVPLNFAAHSPEDKQHDRRHRSARLERIGPKRPFQYRTAVRVDLEVSVRRDLTRRGSA